MEKHWQQWETLFWGAPKSLQMLTAAMELKDACSLGESYDQSRQHIKKAEILLCQQSPSSQSYGFSSSHVWMWELDYKESWAQKNWCFWIVILEKTFESPLDCKEIQPVHPKGKSAVNAHWKDWFWSLNSNTLATWWVELTHLKRPWCWESLKAGEGDDRGWDVWWHHWLGGHEFE